MAIVSMKQFLEAGVHFGHQSRRWHPKMRPFIYGVKNGMHIIDLQQTLGHLKAAYLFARDLSAEGDTLLFAATKRQAREIIQEEAQRCGAYYINGRWLGGLMTNFETVRRSISVLQQIEEKRGEDGLYAEMIKKEAVVLERRRVKLEQALGGIKEMRRLPGALFVIDCNKEHLALKEARNLKMPIIAVVDTNCDPTPVDYIIPGNDDSIRAIRLFAAVIADGVLAGRALHEVRRREAPPPRARGEDKSATRGDGKGAARPRKPKGEKAAAGRGEGHAGKPSAGGGKPSAGGGGKPSAGGGGKPSAGGGGKPSAGRGAGRPKAAAGAPAGGQAGGVSAGKPAAAKGKPAAAESAPPQSAGKPAAAVEAAPPQSAGKPAAAVEAAPPQSAGKPAAAVEAAPPQSAGKPAVAKGTPAAAAPEAAPPQSAGKPAAAESGATPPAGEKTPA